MIYLRIGFVHFVELVRTDFPLWNKIPDVSFDKKTFRQE